MPINQEQRDDWQKETLDRVRRFETRFTRFLARQKFDTQTDVPVYKDGVLQIPSTDVSIKEMLAVIPRSTPGWRDIEVLHKGEFVCWVSFDDPEAKIVSESGEDDRYRQG
jgi:hypothetical protein